MVAKNPKAVRDALARNRREAKEVAEKLGVKKLRELLRRVEHDLVLRLHRAEGLHGPGKDSFTATQQRIVLAQVRDITKQLTKGMKDQLVSSARTIAEKSTESVIDYLQEAETAFRGLGAQALPLNDAAILQSTMSGVESTVLRRLASSGEQIAGANEVPHKAKKGILQRYGMEVIGHFEDAMSEGMVGRKPWSEVRADIVSNSSFLQDAPAYWAERIVRTETANAQNRSNLLAMRGANEDLEDMCKILSCVFDFRTGSDSIAVHGEIRRLNEPFSTWFGLSQHPPDRPNDRGLVVPHRVCWPIPPDLQPRSDAEILARWKLEKKKGAPPSRPAPMSTIPLYLFGK